MTVFILGAGVMQIPAIETARGLGWFVAVADANAQAPGASLADSFHHVDLKDLEGLKAAATSIRSMHGLDAVFTAGTDFSAAVAWLADRLDLPGISHEVALAASDKLRMRSAFAAAGVPSPCFVSIAAGQPALQMASLAGLSLPLVVKPADSMGARGCRLARTPADLADACAKALPYSRSGHAIVEEYMDGPEFSIDAIVVDGRLRIRGIADRHVTFSPYFVELGHTMPSAFGREVVDEVLRVFEAGVHALGITRGAAKGDMKWCPERGGAMIGEIAARLSGGYMSGWTYPYASGIEVTREALEAAAGLEPTAAPADRGWVGAERAYISIPGRVGIVLGLRTALAMPYVKDLFTRVSKGDACVFPSNNVEKCGNVIVQAPDRATAASAAEAAIRAIVVRLEPARPETDSFLRGEGLGAIRNEDGSVWPPSAFSPPAALLAAVEAMPDALPPASGRDGRFVLALPKSAHADSFGDRDWAYRGFLESAELALRLGGADLLDDLDDDSAVDDMARESGQSEGVSFVLGSRFWKALIRGGAQAALYAIDTEVRSRRGR